MAESLTRPPGAERRVRLVLAYDGTDFAGWQIQPGLRTVQGVLEAELGRLHGIDRVRVRGAGRTDAGVHARGQVADAAVRLRLDDGELLRALWRILPGDLRVREAATVPGAFDARRHARSKTYVYRLDRTPAGDPFRARYALHHPYPMAMAALREALSLLPGRRDWTGFAGAACDVGNRVRHLTEAAYDEPRDGEGRFRFSADGFLNHMVRNLVGTLLEVARGRFAPTRIRQVLETRDRKLAGPTAPPHGLCLEQVVYDPADLHG